MAEALAFPALFISMSFIARMILVLIGFHKGPVLRLFEKYGDDESQFQPMPQLTLWSGVFLISAQKLLSSTIFVPASISWLGGFLILCAYFMTRLPGELEESPRDFPVLPVWYHTLKQYTSREERRRIAYMWLRLPARLRTLYNTNDEAFFYWADLVIMSTVR